MSSIKTHRAIRDMELELDLSESDMYCDDFSPEKRVSNGMTETYTAGFEKIGEIYYDTDSMKITIVNEEDLPLYLAGLWFKRNSQ